MSPLAGTRYSWDKGPRMLAVSTIMAVERILTAKIWPGDQTILPPRPETETSLTNPHELRQQWEAKGISASRLPEALQIILAAYISYRFHEQHISFTTLQKDLQAIISFFCWAHDHAELHSYPLWDQTTMEALVRTFLAASYPHAANTYKNNLISSIHTFFYTLARLNLPHPPGYHALFTLRHPCSETKRSIPSESILDRVFNDGVRQLDYDPFARLALTIQFYCGTRVTETCELPLFCFLDSVEEDGSQVLELLIPRGKSNEERRFPIVSVGMGPLLEYMAQVAGMQLTPGDEDIPLHTPRTNARYLETDAERALHWDYLFDRRLHPTDQSSSHPGVLNHRRVGEALQEALLFAAKKNPDGLMREETYSPRCIRKRRIGQKCGYLASVDGITACPICGGGVARETRTPLPSRAKTSF